MQATSSLSMDSLMARKLFCNLAVVAEWLRRLTRNQIPSGSVGSNPTDCEEHFLHVAARPGHFYMPGSNFPLLLSFSRQKPQLPIDEAPRRKSLAC